MDRYAAQVQAAHDLARWRRRRERPPIFPVILYRDGESTTADTVEEFHDLTLAGWSEKRPRY
jgi:hypothetical protein